MSTGDFTTLAGVECYKSGCSPDHSISWIAPVLNHVIALRVYSIAIKLPATLEKFQLTVYLAF